MDMSGEQRIPAPRDVVWQALNDPEILKACIPGCQELVKSSDTQMSARVVMKVGPVSARFEGAVTLCDLDPPNGYRISGEGQGGVAGFAKGEAQVRLEADGNETILRYEVSAQVGGKLAQLGARLIDATARQMSALFFQRFAQEITARQGSAPRSAPEATGVPGQAAGPMRSTASPGASSAHPPRASPAGGMPLSWQISSMLLVVIAGGLAGYFGSMLHGRVSTAGAGLAVSGDFAGAVILMIVAALGYVFGRLNSIGGRGAFPGRDAPDI